MHQFILHPCYHNKDPKISVVRTLKAMVRTLFSMVEGITFMSNLTFIRRKFYTQEYPMSKPYLGPGSLVNIMFD